MIQLLEYPFLHVVAWTPLVTTPVTAYDLVMATTIANALPETRDRAWLAAFANFRREADSFPSIAVAILERRDWVKILLEMSSTLVPATSLSISLATPFGFLSPKVVVAKYWSSLCLGVGSKASHSTSLRALKGSSPWFPWRNSCISPCVSISNLETACQNFISESVIFLTQKLAKQVRNHALGDVLTNAGSCTDTACTVSSGKLSGTFFAISESIRISGVFGLKL